MMRPTATTIHNAAAMPLVPWTITRAEWMDQRRALGKHFGGAAFGLTSCPSAAGRGSVTPRRRPGRAAARPLQGLVRQEPCMATLPPRVQ